MQDDWIKEVLCDCAEWARLHGLTKLESALRDAKRVAEETLGSASGPQEIPSD